MQFLNAVAIMTIAFSLPPILTAQRFTSPCSKGYWLILPSSSGRQFSLAVVIPDEKGKIDLTASRPVVVKPYEISATNVVSVPTIDLTSPTGPINGWATYDPNPDVLNVPDVTRTRFLLEDGILTLVNTGTKASFIPDEYKNIAGFRDGSQVVGFDPDPRSNITQARFTATQARDSFGRSFFQLAGPDGESARLLLEYVDYSLPLFLPLSLSEY